MSIKHLLVSSFLCLLCYISDHYVQAQATQPSTDGYTCMTNQSKFPCQAYAFFRAIAPEFLDLASIGDLFEVSRLMISKPSNISSPSSPLIPSQSLLVPLTCSCNSVNTTTSLSYANISYTIKKGENFFMVSTNYFQNLTTYQSVQVVNPTLVPTNLPIGVSVIIPIFCKCPDQTQLQNNVSYVISYVFQSSDDLSSVASRFGVDKQSIIDVNGNNIQASETLFIPVGQLPQLSQPITNVSSVTSKKIERTSLITGLAIGLGICGLLLLLVSGAWFYRESMLRKRQDMRLDEEKQRLSFNAGWKNLEANLMADVSECLDKYRVFTIEELKEATGDFDDNYLIQGSVYKGTIYANVYAIKKMKWDAREELKILQKVNHGNLVKLEGFCIDSKEASCYLVYEYVENGSLHSWLHGNNDEKLNWKTRLRIAIDVANGLQYIHEHTRPRVVHKDIKTSNILLDSTMRAKIANFGLAKSGCNAITMHIVGTPGYIAPEYLTNGMVSTKMDIFSFGVILLELVSGREAVDEDGELLWAKASGILEGNDQERKEKRLRAFMDNALLQQSCSMESVVNIMAVANACLHRNPSKRPSMVDIVLWFVQEWSLVL